MKFKRYTRAVFLALFMVVLTNCAPLISPFDQYAYVQCTSLKVDVLVLMDHATESYQSFEKEVKELDTKIQKAYEYEKNRPKNEITLKLWNKIIDPNANLYGGFMERWKSEGKLSPVFIKEEKGLVSTAFDQIAQLESKKIKSIQ